MGLLVLRVYKDLLGKRVILASKDIKDIKVTVANMVSSAPKAVW